MKLKQLDAVSCVGSAIAPLAAFAAAYGKSIAPDCFKLPLPLSINPPRGLGAEGLRYKAIAWGRGAAAKSCHAFLGVSFEQASDQFRCSSPVLRILSF